MNKRQYAFNVLAYLKFMEVPITGAFNFVTDVKDPELTRLLTELRISWKKANDYLETKLK